MSNSISIIGWRRGIRVQGRVLLLAAALLCPILVLAEEADVPPLELLEYLGEWEDGDGQWFDPTILQLVMLSGEEQANEEEKDE